MIEWYPMATGLLFAQTADHPALFRPMPEEKKKDKHISNVIVRKEKGAISLPIFVE